MKDRYDESGTDKPSAPARSSTGSELLPCPFCGSPAMTSGDPLDRTEPSINVHCSECGAEGGYVGGHNCREIAVKHWNSRIPAIAQRPANPDAVKMYADALGAANARIAELEARAWPIAQTAQVSFCSRCSGDDPTCYICGKPAAWGRVIDGRAVTVSLTRTEANDEPLYVAPQPADPAYSSQQPETTRNLVESICDDCPPVGYPTDKTRCTPCPRRTTEIPSTHLGCGTPGCTDQNCEYGK